MIKTEVMMLQVLKCRVNIPTALDFVQYFLYMSNSDFEFKPIIGNCSFYILELLTGKLEHLIYI